jgi:hypothetical protein
MRLLKNLKKLKIRIYLIIVLFLVGCSSPDEKIKKIPSEFRGEWIDEFGEFKMVITDSKLFIIDPNGTDTLHKKIKSIYKTGRKDCDDCTNYGIRFTFENDLDQEYNVYLNGFHPELKKFIILELVESVVNPYDESREYSPIEIWKRSDL